MFKASARVRTPLRHPAQLFITLSIILSMLVSACGGGAPASETAPTETALTEVAPTEVAAAPAEVEPTAAPVSEESEPVVEPEGETEPAVEPTAVVEKVEETVAEEEEAAPVVEIVAGVLLTVLTGRVDYMLPESEDWEQAIGEAIPLKVGTQLRAYQLSSARLDLADGSKVLMKPVSKLGMTTYRHEPETPVTQAYVDIPEGEAAFDVNGPLKGDDSSFLVKMPTGVFSVNPEAEEAAEAAPDPPPEQPEPEAAEAAAENPVVASTAEELDLADVTLNVLSGRVDFLLPDGDDWQAAEGDAFSVELGTEVRTYQLSMARLDLADGSKIMMKPTSKMSVSSYLHEPATPLTQAYISVPEGEVAFDVNGPLQGDGSSFLVEMPTGVFSVTGTSFVVNAGSADEPAGINLLEGSVVAGATAQNAETGELEAMFFEMEAGDEGAAMNFMSSEQAAEIAVETGQEAEIEQQVAVMSVVTAQGSAGIETAAESGLAVAVEQGLESGAAGVLAEEQRAAVESAASEGELSEAAPTVIAAEEMAEALAADPEEESALSGLGLEVQTAVEALAGDGTAAREGALEGALDIFADSFEGPQPTLVTDAEGNTLQIMPPEVTINADGTATVDPGKLVDENGDQLSDEALTVVAENPVTVIDPISGEETEVGITDALALPTADPLAGADERGVTAGAALFIRPQQDEESGEVMFVAGDTGVNLLKGTGVASGLGVDADTGEVVPFVLELAAGEEGTVIQIPDAAQLPEDMQAEGVLSGVLDALGMVAAGGKEILESVKDNGLLQTAGELLSGDKASGLLGETAAATSDLLTDGTVQVGEKIRTMDAQTMQTMSTAGLAGASLSAVGMDAKKSTEVIDRASVGDGPEQEALVNSFIGDFTGPQSDPILDAEGNVVGEVPPPEVVFDENGVPQGLLPSTPVDAEGNEFDEQALQDLTSAAAGELFMVDPNSGQPVAVGGGQVATWGIQNMLATTDSRGVGQQSMFPPVTFDADTGEMQPTVIVFTGGAFSGFDAFDAEEMYGGVTEAGGSSSDLEAPRLPGMEFDEQGRIAGQEDLSFVTYDALGQASEWAMPDPFMFDEDGDVLGVQPPPALLFGQDGNQFGMHQEHPHFFQEDFEHEVDGGPQIVYDQFGSPMTTDMNMMAQIMRDESGEESGRQMMGRTTAWDDDFFAHGLALETEQFHVAMFDESGNVSMVAMYSEPVFDDEGGWAGMMPPPVLMHDESGHANGLRESDVVLSADVMHDIFFGAAGERAGMEPGGEDMFEMDFFGASGVRMGGMEFDMDAFAGGGFKDDDGADDFTPWGQGPEAFGSFDSEGQNNFAVTGFYDHEHGDHVGFDEFGGAGGMELEDFDFGGRGFGAPQFFTDDGDAYMAPTIGEVPEDFFYFGPEQESGELELYGHFESEGEFGPSMGSLVGGGGDGHGEMDFFSLPEGMELPPAFNVGWVGVEYYGGGGFGADEGFGNGAGFDPGDTRGAEGGLPPDASDEQIAQFGAESAGSRSECAPGDAFCEEDGGGEEGGGGVADYWDMSAEDVGGRPGEFNAFDFYFGGGYAQHASGDGHQGDDAMDSAQFGNGDIGDNSFDPLTAGESGEAGGVQPDKQDDQGGVGGGASMEFLNFMFGGGPEQQDDRPPGEQGEFGGEGDFAGEDGEGEFGGEGGVFGEGFDFMGQFASAGEEHADEGDDWADEGDDWDDEGDDWADEGDDWDDEGDDWADEGDDWDDEGDDWDDEGDDWDDEGDDWDDEGDDWDDEGDDWDDEGDDWDDEGDDWDDEE